ncbi:polysaccharide lyase family 11 protein [Aaosphaeria arxii CBS 175.79]|uniref:Polysaccharide lyase family 11 protein n=1 Tax=Aaosphaeria arxii CBS 175.79 TaxID=1450172 RepID=A0A6A5X6J5_9PLEO|nr:polysaccharide lyase family 11 protein [Aaosphaeria arxii CBS 175.79]KAF2008404.1 polysaccharide lyase family 11 protein [Aaosphaeria arxii CBS 175.79]
MENLGRGVVAVRKSSSEVLVSWRLLGLDNPKIGFNVYRATENGNPLKLNSNILAKGTNFIDSEADLGKDNHYHVRPVNDGNEGPASGTFTLDSDHMIEPIHRVPIKETGNIKYVWVGDLDGDGEYDYIVDRHNTVQSIEAYTSNGTFLWEVNLGPNSENQNNIEPGATAISIGHWDGVTSYDLDGDGKAEIALRIANGVTFGDGTRFEHANNDEQFIAVLDGFTGKLKAKSPIPTDYIANGPLAARLMVGYLDGKTPHLVAWMKNRQPNKGDFNRMMAAWTFDGKELTRKWVKKGDDFQGRPDGHNSRVIDVDEDGFDEVCEIGFCLNGRDGSMKYGMPSIVVHGDRWHIAKMDPDRKGLQGYGIQQNNENLLEDYYYDATTGKLLWEHYGTEVGDVGRGMVGDIDPNQPGMEVWAFSGLYNAKSNKKVSDEAPWPQLGLWWDGDVTMELYNDGKIEKWNPSTQSVERLITVSKFGAVNPGGRQPGFVADIFGDWREEVILKNEKNSELLIFTTDQPSDIRLYTLAHNPAYRNDMTVKGYLQSHHVDYFLGHNMATPPKPDISYVKR